MNRQFGVTPAHRARADVAADAPQPLSVQLTVDQGVQVASIPEVLKAHHVRGNPGTRRKLPAE